MREKEISLTTVTCRLSGLHCKACVARVSQQLQALAGSVHVTLDPMQVVLTEPTADFARLRAAVASAGSYVLMPDSIPKVPLTQSTPAQSAIKPIATDLWQAADKNTSWLAAYRPLGLIVS